MNENVMTMKDYYNFRKEIRNLYKNDVNQCGDLCVKLLEIRDKYRCVNLINIAIQTFSVDVELADGTSVNKRNEIIGKICNSIGTFLVNNRNNINPEYANSDEFDKFLNAPNYIFCDIICVGNTISITL
jgi:hypothetical protein